MDTLHNRLSRRSLILNIHNRAHGTWTKLISCHRLLKRIVGLQISNFVTCAYSFPFTSLSQQSAFPFPSNPGSIPQSRWHQLPVGVL